MQLPMHSSHLGVLSKWGMGQSHAQSAKSLYLGQCSLQSKQLGFEQSLHSRGQMSSISDSISPVGLYYSSCSLALRNDFIWARFSVSADEAMATPWNMVSAQMTFVSFMIFFACDAIWRFVPFCFIYSKFHWATKTVLRFAVVLL